MVYVDRVCQWCKVTVAVANEQGVLDVAPYVIHQEKYYCIDEERRCYAKLQAMTAYVLDHFDEG